MEDGISGERCLEDGVWMAVSVEDGVSGGRCQWRTVSRGR